MLPSFLLLACAAGAAADDPAALLAPIAAKLHGISSLEAPLTQVKSLAAFGAPQEARGTLVFVRPNRLRMDLEGPGGSILIVDGDTLTLHYKALKRTERLSLANDLRARAVAEHLFLLLDAEPARLATVYRLELVSRLPLTVRLVPKAEALARLLAHIEARFDPAGFVSRLVVEEVSGDRTEWLFGAPKTNAPVPEGRFRLPS